MKNFPYKQNDILYLRLNQPIYNEFLALIASIDQLESLEFVFFMNSQPFIFDNTVLFF
jgi:hypothetical protein